MESQFFQCPPEQCGEDLRREELGIGHEAELQAPVAKLVETVNETRHGPNRVDANFVLYGQPANVDLFRRRGKQTAGDQPRDGVLPHVHDLDLRILDPDRTRPLMDLLNGLDQGRCRRGGGNGDVAGDGRGGEGRANGLRPSHQVGPFEFAAGADEQGAVDVEQHGAEPSQRSKNRGRAGGQRVPRPAMRLNDVARGNRHGSTRMGQNRSRWRNVFSTWRGWVSDLSRSLRGEPAMARYKSRKRGPKASNA